MLAFDTTFWDFESNIEAPERFSAGSNYKAHWRCKGDHRWIRSIKLQQNIAKCSECSKDEVSLRARRTKAAKHGLFVKLYPKLAAELHPEEQIDWSLISIKSYEQLRWLCADCGHSWSLTVFARVKFQTPCPQCRGKVLKPGINDLSTLHPELAKEWSATNELESKEIRANDYAVSGVWRCSLCSHSWWAKLSNRVGGTGCPKCARSNKTSKGQRELYDFIKSHSSDAILEARDILSSKRRLELDIYIPSLRIGVEYNGDYWHSDKIIQKKLGVTAKQRHQEKLELCAQRGIKLLYVWESDWLERREEVKDAILKALGGGTAPPLLLKLSNLSSVTLVVGDSESVRVKSNWRSLKLTLEERSELEKRYLEGESLYKLIKEMQLSGARVEDFWRDAKLLEKRLALGISKSGNRTVKTAHFPEFLKDLQGLPKKQICTKWSIGDKMLEQVLRTHGVTSESHPELFGSAGKPLGGWRKPKDPSTGAP